MFNYETEEQEIHKRKWSSDGALMFWIQAQVAGLAQSLPPGDWTDWMFYDHLYAHSPLTLG